MSAVSVFVQLGNTHTLFAVEIEPRSFRKQRFSTATLADLDLRAVFNALGIERPNCYLGGVVPDVMEKMLIPRLEQVALSVLRLDKLSAEGVLHLPYQPLGDLGFDRVAKLLGGALLMPEKDLILVDMGTAVTVDVLEKGRFHKGGLIMPGEQASFDALGTAAALLPHLEARNASSTDFQLGLNTEACIRLGVQAMQLGMLERVFSRYVGFYPAGQALLTGGGALRVMPWLVSGSPLSVHYVEDLVLLGMQGLRDLQAGRQGSA